MSKKKTSKSLAQTHPKLADQAVGWDPEDFSAGSATKVTWQCSKRHKWNATISARAKRGHGCPYCSGRIPIAGVNDLKTTHKSLSKELVDVDPLTLSAGSSKKVRWRCKNNHEWEAIVANRALKNQGCPFCSRNRSARGENDLKTKYPLLASEADGWDPTEFLPGSNKKMNWVCKKNHRWEARIADRVRGNRCPYCAGKYVNENNDLLINFPKIAKQAEGWDPRGVHSGSHSKRQWKCSKGHSWRASIVNRTSKNVGCPICSNQKTLTGVNDLETLYPNLAIQADGWDPSKINAGSNKVLSWKCARGHLTRTSVASRVKGAECIYCANQAAYPGFNDLKTMHPQLSEEAMGWDPTKVLPGSNRKLDWKCKKGHMWSATVSSRVNGRGCPICVNQKIESGYNDLQTLYPELAIDAFGWDPNIVLAGSTRKMKWKCPNDHVWETSPRNRVSGSGCPSCATYGFDPNLPAYFYLLTHNSWGLLQIGITNDIDRRLKEHQKYGWQVLDVIGPKSGSVIRNLENKSLQYLKQNGALFNAQIIAGKFSGYTESWIEESFKIETISQLKDLLKK